MATAHKYLSQVQDYRDELLTRQKIFATPQITHMKEKNSDKFYHIEYTVYERSFTK
jgi:hypothetical protein